MLHLPKNQHMSIPMEALVQWDTLASLDLLSCVKHVPNEKSLTLHQLSSETNSGMLAFHHDGAPIVAAAAASQCAV